MYQMFCHQCQETAMNKGCSMKQGICGKTAETACFQDLFIWTLKGIGYWGVLGKTHGWYDEEICYFVIKGLFSTITNADFNTKNFLEKIKKAIQYRKQIEEFVSKIGEIENKNIPASAKWSPSSDEEIYQMAQKGTGGWLEIENEDIRSLKATILYGLKGMSAYLEHGWQISKNGKDIFEFILESLTKIDREDISGEELLGLVLETGKYGVLVMDFLDKANAHYGTQEITEVKTGVRNRPGILISGHDFVDLEELLEQTKDKGVDVYTHSEMLPAHYRSFFKKYDNLYGNYGSSWYLQKDEIKKFNGPVLFTSNCLVPPAEEYQNRIFTTGPVGFENCIHIPDRKPGEVKDFNAVIEMAQKCEPPQELDNTKIIGGFGHKQVLALADKVITAIKEGKIKKFVVMAGCDGRHKTRTYFTEIAEKLPKEAVILTAGCAKYRYNKLKLGDIDGIPRVLDAGQCNDSYSLAVIALELQKAFELADINDLPIEFDIAWYEQKAVLVLLALLHLGFKGVRVGPTLPGFLSKGVTETLVKEFNLQLIDTVENDLEKIMA